MTTTTGGWADEQTGNSLSKGGGREREREYLEKKGRQISPTNTDRPGKKQDIHGEAHGEVEHSGIGLQRPGDRQRHRLEHLLLGVDAVPQHEVAPEGLDQDDGERSRVLHHAQQDVRLVRLQEPAPSVGMLVAG